MNQEKIIPISIENELKESYLNYAMSVIVSRALPDVRDGLKPVHRRIMYVLSEMKLDYSAKTRKCAQIVGEVMGKYHPHGDAAIYDTLVRMVQSFSLRYPLIIGQGNFGSIEGDPPAAYRYTEAKMAKIGETLLRNIQKETVNFVPTYDGSMLEPVVLPTAMPNLLVNGSSGIAVGMATNMAPHNLREVCEAILATLINPEITIEDLLQYVKAPDFPTGATIHGKTGYRQAAFTGKGSVVVRAKAVIEQLKSSDREQIAITELPYMCNMKNLLDQMADLCKNKVIEAISDIRNESKKDVRIVIELKRGAQASVVLNQLYQHTTLQSNFSINNLALVNGQPKSLTLKDMIVHFIAHRREVIERRSRYDLRKLKEREHVLLGIKIALENIEAIIELLKKSANASSAREALMTTYNLSEIQAQAILDMRLQRLTSLEVQKIVDELEEIAKNVLYLQDLLANPPKIYDLIAEETKTLALQYGDDRRTEVLSSEIEGITNEDLIEVEDMVVLVSRGGFIKRVLASEFKEQGRGGKGSLSMKLGDDDFVEHIFTGSTHDVLFLVTSLGKGYWLKLYQIPIASKNSKGRHLSNIFEFEDDEEISQTVCFSSFRSDQYLFMATVNGVVKRVQLDLFKNAKMRGIKAINLDEGDKLRSIEITNGNDNIILATKKGKALRFNENVVRAMGRTGRGVCGIKMKEAGDQLVGVCVAGDGQDIFILTENGYGKRVSFDQFASHGRATSGQRLVNTKGKFGLLQTAVSGANDKSVLVITASGKTIKVALDRIPLLSRNAGGVRVVNITGGDSVVSLAISEKSVEFDDADEDMSNVNYAQSNLFNAEEEADDEVEENEVGIIDDKDTEVDSDIEADTDNDADGDDK